MPKKMSDAEHCIMKIVWSHAPEPVRFAGLMEELAGSGYVCRTNTLITLLGRLQKKGYLTTRKVGRINEYFAAVDDRTYREDQARGFLKKYYEGSARGLVTTLIEADLLTPEEYEELRSVLLEQEK